MITRTHKLLENLYLRLMKKKKVVVAMSGGVDSSMAAYFLKEAGYEVRGVTMQLFGTSAHIKRAQDIASKLSVPHEVIRLQGQKAHKIDPFSYPGFCAVQMILPAGYIQLWHNVR